MADYALRPYTAADLPMMAQWLATPAVRDWWGGPTGALSRVTDHMADPLMDQCIACHNGTPFAYLQSCPCRHAPGAAPQFHDQPADAGALDVFIGVPAMLGAGHGAAIVRHYAETLLTDGASAIVIDPDPANLRAIAANLCAGFRDAAIHPDAHGTPVLVMHFTPPFTMDQISHGGPGV